MIRNRFSSLERWRECRWNFDWHWLALNAVSHIHTICEIGIGPLDISLLPFFEGSTFRVIGVEPHPQLAEAARTLEGAEIIEAAIGFKRGTASLVMNGGSSYIESVIAPTDVGCSYKTVTVDIIPFTDIDDGSIDILNVDCEGSEWAVFAAMKSRPQIIGVELWENHSHKNKITDWLLKNGYTIRISSGPTGETEIWSL